MQFILMGLILILSVPDMHITANNLMLKQLVFGEHLQVDSQQLYNRSMLHLSAKAHGLTGIPTRVGGTSWKPNLYLVLNNF